MLTTHDAFCRCRICKPPLVGASRKADAKLILIVLGVAAIAAIAGLFL